MADMLLSVRGLTFKALTRAVDAGKRAGAARSPITSCPYDEDGDQDEQARMLAWIRGWRLAGGTTGGASPAQ